MNFIRNRNFRAGPQTSLEGFICPQNSDKQQKIKVFGRSGGGIFWQPRTFPADPKLISIGNNVKIASGVSFINHDIIPNVLNVKFSSNDFAPSFGCIEIGDNVMIGADVLILPNVRIGSNVIVGAGSVVSKDISDNSVAAGIPCRVVGNFDDLVKKYAKRKNDNRTMLG